MKIVITTVGTTGDIVPFVALARSLQQAGHVIRACSYDLYRSRFEAEDIDFCAIGAGVTWEWIRRVGKAAAAASPLKQFEILRDFHLYEGQRHYQDCQEQTQGFDLAICHGIHTLGQAAVMDNGLRWVGVILDPSLLPTACVPPGSMPNLGRTANRLLWQVMDRSLARHNRPLNELLASVGSQQRCLKMFRTTSPDLNLIACSRHLWPGYPDLPTHFRITGPWLLEEPVSMPDDKMEHFFQWGPKPVVVSFGSATGGEATELSEVLLEGVRQAGQRAVLQAGVANLGTAGEEGRDLLVVGFVPHSKLFSGAACVVHHGGAGTTVAACRAGVPSVVVPHMGDQAFWAAMLARLGVAPPPLPLAQLTADGLADRIQACLTSDSMREKARNLGCRIAQEDGLGEAQALLEAL